MNFGEELSYSSGKKTPSPFLKFRRQRPLEDISNFDSPLLPKIKEEDFLDRSGNNPIETTPRRRVNRSISVPKELKTPDNSQPTSSTPLSRRLPTPKVQKPIIGIIPHNPFEADLLARLHLPICSPNVFSTIVSPTKSLDGENFDWPIEDVSRIKPAAIEEFPESQFTYVEDPETETRAQQTIDTFWKAEKHIVPSPWHESRVVQKVLIEAKPKIGKNVSCQTALSLPPVLPAELEQVLKPFFNQDSDESDDEDSEEQEPLFLSQSGLRRKLMFIQEEMLKSNCPSSPIVSITSAKGLSRTEKESNLLRSPTLSPIKLNSNEGAALIPQDDLCCSQMSVDVQGNGQSLSFHMQEEQVSHSVWQRQVFYEDQTMDSVAHNHQNIFRHTVDGQSTDHGYATETSSINFANHFHSRLPDFTLPAEPWVPHLGSSTPSSQEKQ